VTLVAGADAWPKDGAGSSEMGHAWDKLSLLGPSLQREARLQCLRGGRNADHNIIPKRAIK